MAPVMIGIKNLNFKTYFCIFCLQALNCVRNRKAHNIIICGMFQPTYMLVDKKILAAFKENLVDQPILPIRLWVFFTPTILCSLKHFRFVHTMLHICCAHLISLNDFTND